MYVIVDHRDVVRNGYLAGFSREGVASMTFGAEELEDWIASVAPTDLEAVQGVVLGAVADRAAVTGLVRQRSRVPVIAIEEHKSLEQTLHLLAAGVDDVLRKPVHVKEIIARCSAVWRRINAADDADVAGRLKVFFDNRDPLVDGVPLGLPRRERQILEYLIKNKKRRVTKTQLFNAIYGVFNENVDETVIEGHISKLRKKLRERLGYEAIDAKRFMGYAFIGADGVHGPGRDDDRPRPGQTEARRGIGIEREAGDPATFPKPFGRPRLIADNTDRSIA